MTPTSVCGLLDVSWLELNRLKNAGGMATFKERKGVVLYECCVHVAHVNIVKAKSKLRAPTSHSKMARVT
jgi:hypothetical protein